jgi:hypothetical protein
MSAHKPPLTPWRICLLCVGAFGIQFGFALPQAPPRRTRMTLPAPMFPLT